MNANLLMNFSIDKETNKVFVEREFAAPLSTVWAAWTQKELLDQWWAPKPWKAVTKSMDFTPGGYWHYYMEGPEGERHWCRADYYEIEKEVFYTAQDAFCDEEGNLNMEFPRCDWRNSYYSIGDGKTKVTVEATYKSLEDLETVIQMGFQEGFTMALQNLDELLNNGN